MAVAGQGPLFVAIAALNVVQGAQHIIQGGRHGQPTPIPAAEAHREISSARAQGSNGSAFGMPNCGFGTRIMAECCYHLYTEERQCGCWVKERSFRIDIGGSMDVAIYTHNQYCLLGLSGQVDGMERTDNNWLMWVMNHDPFVSEHVCGFNGVRGFVQATRRLVGRAEWPSLARKLSSPACSRGVGLLGTSWGGTMAEILAGCANTGLLSELQGHSLPSFKVDRLITFGTPPTATLPIENPERSDGCFRGQRVFRASNSSHGSTDLVAYSTSVNGFVHPRQNAVQLIELSDGGFEVKVHPCRSTDTPMEPSWSTVSPYVAKKWDEHDPASFMPEICKNTAKYHEMSQYIWCLYGVKDEEKLDEAYIEAESARTNSRHVLTTTKPKKALRGIR
jgi:hypothetical protein